MFSEAGNRILRKCRSERRLREKASSTQAPPTHSRKDSTFSTTSSAPSDHTNHYRETRQSTDRDYPRRMSEDDWDPLRCHPPLDHDRSPYIAAAGQHGGQQTPPQTPGADSDYGYSHDADIDDIIGSYGLTALRPPPPLANRRPLFQRMKTAEMDIHEGFNFGFTGGNPPVTPTTPTERPHHHHNHHHHQQQYRHQSSMHSAASSAALAARHRRPSTASSTGSECSSIFVPTHSHSAGALPTTPLPTPPTPDQGRVRPRLGGPGSPEFMLKRGEWKRRGIVFVSEEAKVTEDDCFEIP